MKSIRAVLLTAVFSRLLLVEAQALGDRGVAKKALSAQNIAFKKFSKAKLSPEFLASWEAESVCVTEVEKGIEASSMLDNDKFD